MSTTLQRVFHADARPQIVCLCGSSRFYEAFQRATYELTMAGQIVLSIGVYPHSAAEHGHGEGVPQDSLQKAALDELHKRKIDLADYVYVLDVDGYIGDSTRSEIAYAEQHGIPVRYLSGGRPVAGSGLGPEWVRGEDGVPWRRAARVLLLDADGRVLLARGHDVDNPSRSWWFTIGGGIEPGESDRAAAVRELFEETGIEIDEDDLDGPVMTREAVFDFAAEHVRQDEVFFVARVERPAELSRDGWTDIERDFMDDMAWWSAGDLDAVDLEVFPAVLPDVVAELGSGWDGQVRHLGLQDDDAAARVKGDR